MFENPTIKIRNRNRRYYNLIDAIYTWYLFNVPTDGGEGGEAVVEGVKELPPLVVWEDGGAGGGDDAGEEHDHHDQVHLHTPATHR